MTITNYPIAILAIEVSLISGVPAHFVTDDQDGITAVKRIIPRATFSKEPPERREGVCMPLIRLEGGVQHNVDSQLLERVSKCLQKQYLGNVNISKWMQSKISEMYEANEQKYLLTMASAVAKLKANRIINDVDVVEAMQYTWQVNYEDKV